MATTTPNFGWVVPTSTDLVKDGATAIETLGDSIDASMAELKGGTTGQVLSKTSNTDMDFTWVAQDDSNAIQNAIVTAKGDLIGATANATPARLGVGTNNQVLAADSTTATGLKWVTPAAGGKVLQVVNASTNTAVTVSSTTYTDTGLTATITPSSATSKVLVLVSQNGGAKSDGNANNALNMRLMRGATSILQFVKYGNYTASATRLAGMSFSTNYLDSPATTSATTYKIQLANVNNGASVGVQEQDDYSTITLIEIGA